MPSITVIQLNKLRTCTFSRSIRADDLGKSRPAQSMGGGDYIIAAYRAGKSARIVCSTISPDP